MMKKIIILLFFLALFVALPKTALGFGITPAEINLDHLKPGDHFERDVYIVRPVDESNEEMQVVIETDLPEIGEWVKFDPGANFTFPKGKNATTFHITIDVPRDAQYKNYKGQITVKGTPNRLENEGVTMIKGAVLQLNLITTDLDVSQLTVLNITAPEVNEGDPVRVILKMENTGNTAIAPDRVVLNVMDLFEKPMEELENSNVEKVSPYTTKEVVVEFNSMLAIGQYRADVDVYLNKEIIKKQRMVLTVNAKPSGAKEPTSREFAFKARFEQIGGPLLIALGLAGLAGILILITKKGKRKDSDLEKKLSRMVNENKALTLVVIGISLFLLLGGLYISFRSPDKVELEEKKDTSQEASSSAEVKEKEVKGVQTETVSEEKLAPIQVVDPNIKGGNYPVYQEPDFSSEIVYRAETDETLAVEDENEDWYYIITPSGYGWLPKTSVKKANN